MVTNEKYCRQAALCGCLCLVSLLVGCCIEDIFEQDKITVNEEGVVISKLPMWEKDISERGWVEVSAPIFHDDKVIVPSAPYDKSGMLIALDTASGEEVWLWSDYVDGYDFDVLSREGLNSKGNLVIYNDNNLFCAVNLDDGTTLWTDVRPGSSHANAIQIVGDHYYYPYELEENGVRAQVLMRGDIHSTNYEQLIELPLDSIQLFNNAYGSFYTSHVYTESGSIKAFIPFSENVNVFKSQSFNSFISYNISDGVYDFEKVRLPDTVALSVGVEDSPVMIRDMMMISAGDFIYGVNRHTGEVAWTRKVFANSLSDGRIITKAYKDRLFAVNETGSRHLTMELDPLTGETKWIDVGNGGSTYPPLYFLNDVLYFISWGDGRLYAYDINGGKLLWKLQSPGPYHDSFIIMQVHKAESAEDEDMLVACSWKNAYRFEPAR